MRITSFSCTLISFSIAAFIFIGCSKSNNSEDKSKLSVPPKDKPKMEIIKTSFGKVGDKEVFLYTLKNNAGMEVRITNYGGIVTHIFVPDKNGKPGDVVLGFDSLNGYLQDPPYFGALVGRYANRIANGKFSIDGKEYALAINNGPNHLHGGLKGFDKVVWNSQELKNPSTVGLRLDYLSKDMEEGYPGNLEVTVEYILNNKNELKVKFNASTDKKTVVNLTNHSYFNLGGVNTDDILSHELIIYGNRFTPVDKTLIPTGELSPVKGTPMDFTTAHEIGKRIEQVEGGYDHNWVLNDSSGKVSLAARVFEETSGRVLEVLTDQPGIQFYSGNFLDSTITGKNNTVYIKHSGFCLETQHFPDSPNHGNFPSTLLSPGEKYEYNTIFRFLVRKDPDQD